MGLSDGAGQQLAYNPPNDKRVERLLRPPELLHLLKRFCRAATLSARRSAFVEVVRWTRQGDGATGELTRLVQILDILEADLELCAPVQQSLGKLLAELDSLTLFAEAGLPSVHPFTTEIIRRLVGRVLPSARRDSDTAKLLSDLYSRESYVQRFTAQPPELFERTVSRLTPPDNPAFWERQLHDLHEAMRLLAARISGLGLAPEMRNRSGTQGIARSPFYHLIRKTEELIACTGSSDVAAACLAAWKQEVAGCRQQMEVVYGHMESEGISVELVFDLKTIQACLQRMETIAAVLTAPDSPGRLAAVHALLSRLEGGNLEDKRISSLLRENLNLLARKIVDRTGDTGEHYIATSRAEYRWMWLAALGGGLLTVFTAALKMRIVEAGLPLFFEGFAAGTNYAVSFILLQVFGLVLATKQPATTAATFARIIRDNRGQQRSSKLTDFVAHITSTQLAAALGNVLAVSAGAVAFEWLWKFLFTQSYLARESASHVYETLHPFASGTAFYAIVTGIILWLAALAGSWIENAAVYYDFAEAIAQHPLGLRLSQRTTKKFAHIVRHNIGGWSTSIVLGYLLGFTPVAGAFFGLPLDVRHVTLSTGTLALAAARFGTASLGDRWFLYAVEGIGVVFVLNLTVSFMIALYVALRAYDIGFREQLRILRSIVTEGVRSPLRFIVPQFSESPHRHSAAAPEETH
jgi:site-specific recombinase